MVFRCGVTRSDDRVVCIIVGRWTVRLEVLECVMTDVGVYFLDLKYNEDRKC